MSLQAIKEEFYSLKAGQKMILCGSLLSLFSMFLPVYSDFNQFGSGVVYYGITGPLDFIGLAIVAFSLLPIIAFIKPFTNYRDKKFMDFEKASQIYFYQVILLTFLMGSTFLDSEFGVNISVKELRAGLILAFLGSALAISGMYLSKQENSSSFSLQNQDAHSEYRTIKAEPKIERNEEKEFLDSINKTVNSRMHRTISQMREEPPKETVCKNDFLSKQNYNLRMDL